MTLKVMTHGAFSRQSVVRETFDYGRVPGIVPRCSNCGQAGRNDVLYRYGVENDDRPGRYHWYTGLFCCKSCADSYHGEKIVAK